MKADCGSYLVTMYKGNILTRGEKLEERETNQKRRRK